ncbi:MAG: Slx4p interacting protein [Chrysothrix sp. TS-e1954]|nr:MAG: Slx4p interacting protein [Chrysothrix sp. TS-e1954]
MALLVTGFPSHIAALQFEFAWQNIHKTRHVPRDETKDGEEEEAEAQPSNFFNYKTGSPWKRPGKPLNRAVSLEKNLLSLHVLLRVKSFDRLPLELRFYSEDAMRLWNKMLAKASSPIRASIKTLACAAATTEQMPPGESTSIDALDVSYAPSKPLLKKSNKLVAHSAHMKCKVCKSEVSDEDLLVVCPADNCSTVTHTTCLCQHSLQSEGAAQAAIPIQGICPSCQRHFPWMEVMRDLSLRIRGSAKAAALLQEKRRRSAGGVTDFSKLPKIENSNMSVDQLCVDNEYSETEEMLQNATQEQDEVSRTTEPKVDGFESLDEAASSDDDSSSPIPLKESKRIQAAKAGPPHVVANSDWDDIDEEV